ncbi:MAG TPA: diguanylate cyclase [Terriglobia bacterium]|nr:diguanylate cyclase [Terriglobia bacterium]
MKVLMAEDDLVSRRRLEANLLSWNYEVEVARDGNEAWRMLQGENAPRLAILDWMMPGMDGLRVCEKVRKVKAEPYVYILLLTAKDRKENVVEGLEAGADDYLTKPYDAQELKARLRTGRRILALQEALLSARDALRFQASLDPLTGVWNRTAILGILRRELARTESQGHSLTVFKADLDRFSQVNERHGDMAGDAALREIARRIQNVNRLYDAVGRLGGEEFLIVAPGHQDSKARGQAERVRASISEEAVDLSEGEVRITASVGAVTVSAAKGVEPNAILHAADAALSRAKSRGGNRVEVADPQEIPLLRASAQAPRGAPQIERRCAA